MELKGQTYELRYDMNAIEVIEEATGTPLMVNLGKNSALISLRDLKLFVAYGLKDSDGSAVEQEKAIDIASKLIQEKGYTEICTWVYSAIERDCPFFFQAV